MGMKAEAALAVAQAYTDSQIKKVESGGVSDAYLQEQISNNATVANKVSRDEVDTRVNELLNENKFYSGTNLIKEFEPFDIDYSSDTKSIDITSAEFLNTFYDKYIGYHSDGMRVTKKSLGKDESGTYDVFEYDFCPKEYKKTILITSGMHTYELPASFGLAKWIEQLMTSNDDSFEWLRKNIRVIVIPIVNPWGFNQKTKKYGNVNGVNPNRNFDDWNNTWESFPIYSANPEDDNYNEWNVKGEKPFSEAETCIIRDWLYAHNNAEFWIDCHTGVDNLNGENWIIYESGNPNINKITNGLNALTERISTVYGKTAKNNVEINKDTSIKVRFSTYCANVPQMVIEQSQYCDSWGNGRYNESILITEYATTIHAYVMAQLQDVEIVECTKLVLNHTSLALVDDVSKLVATATPKNTTDGIFWTTSDGRIATVCQGIVKPVGIGTCTITVLCGNKSASCQVTVDIYGNISKTETETVSADVFNDISLIADYIRTNKTWGTSSDSLTDTSNPRLSFLHHIKLEAGTYDFYCEYDSSVTRSVQQIIRVYNDDGTFVSTSQGYAYSNVRVVIGENQHVNATIFNDGNSAMPLSGLKKWVVYKRS